MRTILLALLAATPAVAQTPAQIAHNFWNAEPPPAATATAPTRIEPGAFTPATLARLANTRARSRTHAPTAQTTTAFAGTDLARLRGPAPAAPAPRQLASTARPHG